MTQTDCFDAMLDVRDHAAILLLALIYLFS